MSENESAMSESTTEITSYDDPDAPWNQEYTEAEMANWNDGVIAEFRQNQGKVGGAYEGGELVLLTTTGAKSGKQHMVPLGLLRRPTEAGEVLYVSSFIEGKYPAWFYNAKKNSQVTIEHGAETFQGTCKVLEGEEYDEFAAWALGNNPMLAEYQAKVDRPLPLAVLTFGK
ncbi:nitroreductase family deazaflavin-dependent oxidoreductase [Nocardia uniformis]|uniref:Nitroreductase family deazaflavin-dependent oxidoreductase n=1 Tax=Nocardia uniformis TaxID=53432 RepID=A0A849CBN3_9NOCA|nr:nitroreductase/quinone reductase family protein [Nocardia uniformis]NNH73760.1 nitroreductase family deazaflavin-dependent oxidoreductase [Nocardia uniformis]